MCQPVPYSEDMRENMSPRAKAVYEVAQAVRLIAAVAFVGVFVLVLVFQALPTPPQQTIAAPEPTVGAAAAQAVSGLEAQGMECAEKPALTETIVFEFEDGTAQVLGFDAAYAAAESGQGSVIAYCQEA